MFLTFGVYCITIIMLGAFQWINYPSEKASFVGQIISSIYLLEAVIVDSRYKAVINNTIMRTSQQLQSYNFN